MILIPKGAYRAKQLADKLLHAHGIGWEYDDVVFQETVDEAILLLLDVPVSTLVANIKRIKQHCTTLLIITNDGSVDVELMYELADYLIVLDAIPLEYYHPPIAKYDKLSNLTKVQAAMLCVSYNLEQLMNNEWNKNTSLIIWNRL